MRAGRSGQLVVNLLQNGFCALEPGEKAMRHLSIGVVKEESVLQRYLRMQRGVHRQLHAGCPGTPRTRSIEFRLCRNP